jgi:predicted kinase
MGNGLVMLTGLQATGKTYSAGKIGEIDGFRYVSKMKIMQEMGYQRFPRKRRGVINELFYGRITSSLEDGIGVIADSTFTKAEAREKVYDIASSYSVNVILLEITAPEEEVKRRLKNRQRVTGLVMQPRRVDVYNREKSERESISNFELLVNPHVSYAIFDTHYKVFTQVRVNPASLDLVGRIEDTLTKGYYSEDSHREAAAAL